MSCYVVTPETVNAVANGIVSLRLATGKIRESGIDVCGAYVSRVLADENMRSFNHRYPRGTYDDIMEEERILVPRFVRRHYPMGLSVACAMCLDYQSCETEDYRDTVAAGLLGELIGMASDGDDGKGDSVTAERIRDGWGFGGISKTVEHDDGTVTVDYRYKYARNADGTMGRTCDRITFDAAGWPLLMEHGVFSDINE